MADTESGQEKTEPATPRRREEARREGQVAKSQEVNSVIQLLAAVVLFYFYGPRFYEGIAQVMQFYLQESPRISISPESFPGFTVTVAKQVLDLVWPFVLTFILVAFVSNIMQVGFLFSSRSLIPRFSRLNPINGIKRILSPRGVFETGKALAKIAIVAPVMIYTIYEEIPILLLLSDQPVRDIFVELGFLSYRVVFLAVLILLVLAILDYAFQRYDFEKSIRMTKQEVKEEIKQTQGDPRVRARIRSIQREIARRRMMAAVPAAEVVVTNPTEYAVALSYKSGLMPAPQVVAKGRGYVAQRIKEIARQHDVPMYEDRLLARALFKLEIGSFIPPELYAAVAEVLAWVNHLTGRYQHLFDEASAETSRRTAQAG